MQINYGQQQLDIICWTFCTQENMDAYVGFVNGAGDAVVIDG